MILTCTLLYQFLRIHPFLFMVCHFYFYKKTKNRADPFTAFSYKKLQNIELQNQTFDNKLTDALVVKKKKRISY